MAGMTLQQLREIDRQRDLASPPTLDAGVVVGTLSAQQTIAVNCSGSTEICLVPVDLAPVLGDLVVVGHVNGKPIVLGRLTGTASTPTPPPTRPTIGVQSFPAIDAATYAGTSWRTDTATLVQGTPPSGVPNTGAWFYGVTPRSALAGATVTQARVRLRRRSGGSTATQTVNVYPHSSDTRPSGNVTRVGGDGPASLGLQIGLAAWVTLPTAWGQHLLDVGGGLYIAGGDFLVVDGRDVDPQSGLLELTWSR
jgi:hypothetical protein